MNVDRMVEEYWDRKWEEMQAEDAWDRDDPDWGTIYEIISDWYTAREIGNFVRDYIEGDGDLIYEIFRAGLLDGYVPPEAKIGIKDPDKEWDVVDGTFERYWQDDELMVTIWEEYEPVAKGICDRIKDKIYYGYGYDDIRGIYNRREKA